MQRNPEKLTSDPIAEAICELRFGASESGEVPELAIGQLMRSAAWPGYKAVRLPVADLPIQVRQQDPKLLYHPVVELQNPEARRFVKLGHNVLSFHALSPYPGWKALWPELEAAVDHVFSTLTDLTVFRIGLRYLNLFRSDVHNVSRLGDLNLRVELAGRGLDAPLNLTYIQQLSKSQKVQVRISDPEYLTGPNLSGVSALVDVDVFTPNDVDLRSLDDVKDWILAAHEAEKTEFFKLFTDKMLQELQV